MNLAIDISQIVYKGTGVGRFTQGLTNTILDFDKPNNWTFFFSALRRKLDPEIENKIIQKGFKLIKWKLPPTLLSFFWNDLHSYSGILNSKILNLKSFDFFITSDWTEPALPVKKATIVHDLVYLKFPETVDQKILATQKKRLNWVKKESALIFADSESTKNDLIELLKIESKKIITNYPGVEIQKPSKEQINRTLKKYNLNKPFILTVGKLEPRKNIPKLIDAFYKLKNKNIDLVIVGPKGWDNKQYNNIAINQSNIKLLGLISDEDLNSLYSSCLFFVYPSLWEGFGYPVVEAMKLGAPVATSKTSSLTEIAKDSALLFDPNDSDNIAAAINKLITADNLRKSLIKKGLEKSKIFTWRNYFTKMINELESN